MQNKTLNGFHKMIVLDSMKTTIDIPEKTLSEALAHTHAKTKRDAVVQALEEYNRIQRVKSVVQSFGFWKIALNSEIESGDLAKIKSR
jgi:hypothetical protein